MQGRADAFDDAVEAAEIRPRALRRAVGRAPLRTASCRPTTGRRSAPGSGGSTTSASRSTRSASSRPSGGEVGPPPGRRRRAGGSMPASSQRLTGLVALEGQARLLLNDLREYQAWLELTRRAARSRPRWPPTAGCATSWSRAWRSWPRPSGPAATRSRRTATSSRRSGCCPRRPVRTSGSTSRSPAYLELGAPAPEDAPAPTAADRARHRLVRLGSTATGE